MDQAIVVKESNAPMAIEEIVGQVNLIQNVMKKVMTKDEHYGIIPGTGNKPSLLKPGAEKLSMTFRMAPEYEIQGIDMEGGHREYETVCRLATIETGVFLGSGVGNCNTKESKYRYRSESTGRPVPAEYWKNKDRDVLGGPQFQAKKKSGKWVVCEQVEHDNPADYYNMVKKMSKKRAFVDAVLTVTAASDIFTQDVEDMVRRETSQNANENPNGNQPEHHNPSEKPSFIDQADKLISAIETVETVEELSKHHTATKPLIKTFPDNLKKKVMVAVNARYEEIVASEKNKPEENTQTSEENSEKTEPQKDAKEHKARPEFVKELCDYMDSVPPAMLEGAMETIKTESFGKLCEGDQEAVITHCDKQIIKRDETDVSEL